MLSFHNFKCQALILINDNDRKKRKLLLYGPQGEKTCLQWFLNNKGADQPGLLRRLISAFVIRFLESIISKLATSKFSIF